MNKDVFERRWTQLKYEIRGWWSKLTEEDVEKFHGQYDVLVGMLQEKYGCTREQAEEEIDQHLREYQAWLKQKGLPPL